jgi:pyrophosphatase PpaX
VEHITACFGEPLLLTMAREFPGVDPKESADVYRSFQMENADRLVTIFPGIKELLADLKDAGYVLGVVTSRTRESAQRYMDMFGIASYFSDLVSCDDTSIHKPNPEPLLLAMSRLGAAPEEALMIGDSPFDIKCANNAGVDSVMVNWRITCDETSLIDDAKVDYWIHKPSDLVELLKTI